MKIYKMNKKEIRDAIESFNKTYYGKITFVLSFSVPLFSIILFLVTMLLQMSDCYLFILELIVYLEIMLAFISFVLGCIHYYKELKDYIGKKIL